MSLPELLVMRISRISLLIRHHHHHRHRHLLLLLLLILILLCVLAALLIVPLAAHLSSFTF
jgi:hypothetical protein